MGKYVNAASGQQTGETVTIKKKGKKPLSFEKGGLHESLGISQGRKIPENKIRAAAAGRFGEKARAQAQFYLNILKKGGK